MQVRTFESKDMASGLKMIKKELGPDALILSTKTIRDKSAGLLGKRLFEITAAVDDIPQQRPSSLDFVSDSALETFSLTPQVRKTRSKEKATFSHIVDDSLDQYLHTERPESKIPEPPIPQMSDRIVNNGVQTSLQGEVDELRDLVKTLGQQIIQISERDETTYLAAQHLVQKQKDDENIARYESSTPAGDDHVVDNLLERGVNIETARTIADTVREDLSEQELSDPELVHSKTIDIIQNLIEIISPATDSPFAQKKRIAFVGPTGVGKTTTLAKVAASYLKNHSKSVALITIDTYRIAAVEQLKVYADIMLLPVEIVITPGQLEDAINKHSDKDLILIDTAGRSPKDTLSIDELSTFFTPELNIEKHLVLSATTRESELVTTIKRFSRLEIANTIFTKVDECDSLGVLLNVQLQNPAPLSYITNGQKVPEDLLQFSPRLAAELIMTQNEGSLND